jgi:hypothetical protein
MTLTNLTNLNISYGGYKPILLYNPNNPNNLNNDYNKSIISAYGPISSVSFGMKTGNNYPEMIGPNLAPYPHNTSIKTGGKMNLYDNIVDPYTNKKIKTKSRKGNFILNKYLDKLNTKLY